MKINKYIHTLIKQLREPTEGTDRDALRARLAYARAYRQGEDALKRYRDKAIAAEIGKVRDKDAQIAILANEHIYPEEYEAYQTFRVECKAKVDAEISELASELEAALAAEG